MSKKRTALYRHFDADGNLLYVGISISAVGRLAQHARGSLWADKIASVTVEYFRDRSAAADAEKRAIQTERPLHNVVHARAANDNVERTDVSPDPDDRLLPAGWRDGCQEVKTLPPCPDGDEWLRGSSMAHAIHGRLWTLPAPRYQLIRRDGRLGAMYWLLSDLEPNSNADKAA